MSDDSAHGTDTELKELERFETLVRGPGWVPDVDEGEGLNPDTGLVEQYEEWTGKWYTPTRPDGTGGHSLALYADDEELLYARYIAALRNAAPRLIRATRHLASLDRDGLVTENESLRRRIIEVERERDEQLEHNANARHTVESAFDLAQEYYAKRDALRKSLGARWNESIEEACARLATEPSAIVVAAAKKYAAVAWQREQTISSAPDGSRDEATEIMIAAMTKTWLAAHAELLSACGVTGVADPQAPDRTHPE